MKKNNMSASDTSIQIFLNMEKQDIANTKKLNMNFLTVNAPRKFNGKYLGILIASLIIT